jgi:hypothetical protein
VSAGQKKWCATWLALHFCIVILVSLNDLASIVPADRTFLGQRFEWFCDKIGAITTSLLGRRLSPANPLRQIVATYANCAGIELGYSYFAPSVSENPRLIFELHYPDGHVSYDLPHVGSAASGYRVAALLDSLQHLRYRPLREAIVQTLAYPICREHSDAVMGRAFFATAHLPAPEEFRAGGRPSYKLLYTYEIRLQTTHSD